MYYNNSLIFDDEHIATVVYTDFEIVTKKSRRFEKDVYSLFLYFDGNIVFCSGHNKEIKIEDGKIFIYSFKFSNDKGDL